MPSNNPVEQKPATLDDVVTALDEILTWLKISGTDKVKTLLQNTLDTSEKRLVYQQSDGKTVREINAVCGVGASTVSNYWKKWYKLGLMKKVSVKGGGDRHFRAFDLEDYGIDVPKIAVKNEAVAGSETTIATEERGK